MKKLLLRTLLFALVIVPFPAMTGVQVDIDISLPPLIVFDGTPELIVLPETDIYVVPKIDEELFFYDGWWWRQWKGCWYRSRNYSSGWDNYTKIPSFYNEIPYNWRDDYRAKRWKGDQWNPQLIPHEQVQESWSRWEKTNHWENFHNLKPGRRLQEESVEIQQQTEKKLKKVKQKGSQQQSIDAQQQQLNNENNKHY